MLKCLKIFFEQFSNANVNEIYAKSIKFDAVTTWFHQLKNVYFSLTKLELENESIKTTIKENEIVKTSQKKPQL